MITEKRLKKNKKTKNLKMNQQTNNPKHRKSDGDAESIKT